MERLLFDHVIVATGYYTVPNMPDFDGLAKFPKRVLHWHNYRGADKLVSKNLLIIDGNCSGEDIAMQCYKYGESSITISYRSYPMGLKWSDSIKEVPILQRVEEYTAYFKDGIRVDNIDSINI